MSYCDTHRGFAHRDALAQRCLVCELRAQRERAEKAEAESAGRLRALEEKAEEARREWQRAENAEAERDEARREAQNDYKALWEQDTAKLQADLDLANLKRCQADPPCCEAVEGLRADLDAALLVCEAMGAQHGRAWLSERVVEAETRVQQLLAEREARNGE